MDEVKQEIVLECTEFETSSLQPFAENDESLVKNNLCSSKSWSIAYKAQQRYKSCGLTNATYPLHLVQEGTIIIYFSSEDGFLSEEIMLLDKKFYFYREFFCITRKHVGDLIIFNKNPNYLLCGCIIKKGKNDKFDFSALQKCLRKINRKNKKYKFPYIAFQAFEDNSYFNKKISNMIKNSVSAVEVYICWSNQETDVQQYENDKWNKIYSDNWHKWTKFPACPGTSQTDWFDYKYNSPDMSNSELTAFHLAENSHWDNTYDNEMHLTIEYELFKVQNYDTMVFSKVIEINSIHFDLLKNYSLAYFVTEDMNVDIEFQENNNFGNILGQLLNQKQKAGTAAIVKHTFHSFTYLAIARQLKSKVLLSKTIFSSLQQIREHATEHNVKKIVFPNIRLSHKFVEEKMKYMLEFIFRNIDVKIVLSSSVKKKSVRKSKNPTLKHMKSSLFRQTKEKSIIIYFCGENGCETEEMKIWNKLFNFLGTYRKNHKLIDNIIISYTSYTLCRLHRPNYALSEDQVYGCIVYKDDGIDFVTLQKCISKINSINKMKKIRNVYVQAVHDSEKSIDNFKIINILMSTLEEVNIINVCWPDDLCISEPFIKLTVT